MKASPIFDAFNAGEFSPLTSARVRLEKYRNALRTCENAIPILQGGLTRRTGTMFVAEAKTNTGNVRLVEFEFNVEQAYILEFSASTIRFYKDNGQILSGGSPYEVTTTYSDSEIFDLKFTQSADVLYITHPAHAPAKLSRLGDTSWTLADIDFYDGPYLSTNTGTTTIAPSATTGSITLTASAALFASTDVGRQVRIQHSSTWGSAKITAFTSDTLVSATVVRTFGGTTAQNDWRLGAWSDTTGYPSCVTFFEDRLWFGGASNNPQRLDGSNVSDYENFAPTEADGTVIDSNAISVTLNASNVNVIRWLIDDEKGLLVGTVGGEWIVRASAFNEAISPTNITAKRSTTFGSANVQPVRAGKAALYLQRAKRKVRELAYVYEVDGFRSPDMTPFSEHVLKGGATQMAYQQEPFSIVWFVRSDGQLIGFTYERDQDVLGWHRHIIGGTFGSGNAVVTSCASIPATSGEEDELWVVVKRTINGTTKQYIEYITPRFESESSTYAHFVDSGLKYDGAATTSISGLDHLEGQTVTILADGAVHPDKVVSSGSITLDRSASVVIVGLGYNTNIETLNIEAGAADGTAQGKTKRITRVGIRLFQSLGLKYGPSSDKLDVMTFRTSSDNTNAPPPLFTGDKSVNWNGHYETTGRIYLRQYQPLPLTILGIFPQVVTQDR